MCGIVGYTGMQQAATVLLEGLKRLEYRGYDSAGVAVIKDSGIDMRKVSGRISKLCEETNNGEALPGCVGIGHTRWATHGAPTDMNAHPHKSNDGRFAVVHNGIIENYQSLRDELIGKGYLFESETDTEVIVHLLEMYYTGDLKKTVLRVSSRLQGSYALGVICTDYPHEIVAVREASPLIIGIGVGENFFASDITALVPYTRNVIYLEDGEFARITPDEIQVFDLLGKIVKKEVRRVTWDVQAAERGGYEHFMLKEIMEQPHAVEATIHPRIQNGEIKLDDERMDAGFLNNINRIVITACGSAFYAGCAGRYAIESLCKVPVITELASELRYSEPMIDEHTLVIVLSQSGETADTIAAIKECKSKNASILAIVNVVGSTVAKLADFILYTWAGPEIAVATTKGYTTQLVLLYLFALYTARVTQRIDDKTYRKLLRAIKTLPRRIQESIDMNPTIASCAEKYKDARSIFFIGRNTDQAAALEGALKMKEISYIHAEAYAAGELKHGTIALIEEHQPVIALCCNEKVWGKTMNNIIEVKSRGGDVLAVTTKKNGMISSVADDILYIPETETLFTGLVEIVPLQLLAYYTAKNRNCDIDKPKNLAKSVTVE
ncbi:MAG: glutamine--fructose-6-phosphate transaminase (isomerizing) [Oscillospiraceae bacterium]|nr:glutamine--fructose-6-phosphate transaminase (isomerizing) [Oscillospiraceae bacterium]